MQKQDRIYDHKQSSMLIDGRLDPVFKARRARIGSGIQGAAGAGRGYDGVSRLSHFRRRGKRRKICLSFLGSTMAALRTVSFLLLSLLLSLYSMRRSTDLWSSRGSNDHETAETLVLESLLQATLLQRPQHTQRLPGLVWLLSFPNSGTSYTMTLVERSTDLSTATNYGPEVSDDHCLPMDPHHPEGPFWDGLNSTTTPRPLPDNYVLVKTHCGSRCVHCSDYESSLEQFTQDCARTSFYDSHRKRREGSIALDRIAKYIHLIRNPFDNIVARFHLDARHLKGKRDFARNATGFAEWCHWIRSEHSHTHFADETTRRLVRETPCGPEFFRWTQWHNLAADVYRDRPTHLVYYEDYASDLNATALGILAFLEQTPQHEWRPFRELPNYDDHFAGDHKRKVQRLIQHVATPETWKLMRRYFSS